jgi:hypothetical protein
MADNTPVYSKFYGDKDNVVYEKFFIKKENLLIGALFHCSDKKLCGLTVEHFDEKGRPIEFDRFSMDGESKRKLDSIFYTYDNDRIIKAESIFSLDIDRELKLYDDELYVKIGLILDPSIERMNPESVETFDFALRRRFKWVNIKANDVMQPVLRSMHGEIDEKFYDKIKALNAVISGDGENEGGKMGLNEDYHIGPAYFKEYKPNDDQNSRNEIWCSRIKPILCEYIRGRKPSQIEAFLKKAMEAFEAVEI